MISSLCYFVKEWAFSPVVTDFTLWWVVSFPHLLSSFLFSCVPSGVTSSAADVKNTLSVILYSDAHTTLSQFQYYTMLMKQDDSVANK